MRDEKIPLAALLPALKRQLRAARELSGVKLEAVAKEMNLHPNYLSSQLGDAGSRPFLSLERLFEYCQVVGCSMGEEIVKAQSAAEFDHQRESFGRVRNQEEKP